MSQSPDFKALADRVSGAVLTRGDDGFAEAGAGFNSAVENSPDAIVVPESTADVVAAMELASAHGLKVNVQSSGHGAHDPVTSGVLIVTTRLDGVSVDPGAKTATAGGGARWGAVIEAAAAHGLAPITGSSWNVAPAGYLLGGGLGPLARSHGFSSDYLESATIVTGKGGILTASAEENPDLLWALRGGRPGIGVITEMRIRLVEMPELYAGALFFDSEHIEAALRGWIEWTKSADLRVTTSVAIVRFPPFELIPDPLRGRTLLTLRFAFPGPAAEGEELAAPLRALAPLHIDGVRPMELTETAQIHNDPTDPGPAWLAAALLGEIDDDFATAVLKHAGPDADSLFVAVELRHLGGQIATDVDGGSAASGRSAAYTFGAVSNRAELFETDVPAAGQAIKDDIADHIAPVANINFAGSLLSQEHHDSSWPPETLAKIAEVRAKYDPDGVVAWGYLG